MDQQHPPTDSEIQLAIVRALEQMRLQSIEMTRHSERLTDYVARIDARVAGTEAVAAIVDENETTALIDRQTEATKAVISHLYEKSQQYVTVVVAGAYAAYFATLSTVSARFSDSELRMSALLMTLSITIFVLWEVGNIAIIAGQSFRGKLGHVSASRWYQILWAIVLASCLLTAMPAVAYSSYSYISNLLQRSPPVSATIKRPPPTARKAPGAGP